MNKWRIFLAMALLFGSYFVMQFGIDFAKNSAVQLLLFLVAMFMGTIALGFAQDDGRDRERK